MTRLLVVRHAESTWNAESRWQGQADPPLSALGERQAIVAADALAARGAKGAGWAVWTSDLDRARRTGELIAARLGLGPVRVERRLRERAVGEWTGLTRADIEERWPGYLAARRSPPDFESEDSLLERVLAGLAAVAAGDAIGRDDVLVVTHGGVVRTVERHLGAEAEPLQNLSGRWLVADGASFVLGERERLLDPDDVAVTLPRSL